MFKKIYSILLMAAAAAMAFCSCQKQIPDVPSGEISEILFTVNDTKAFTETTASVLQSKGFKVAAIIDADNSVMFNSALTYSDGAYSVPGAHYYFPASGTMSFYAVYPEDETIAVSNGAATLTYTHNPDDDLIVAKATNVGKSSSPVQMNFGHISHSSASQPRARRPLSTTSS